MTRPEPDAHATAALLRARGFRPLLAPMLRIAPLPARLPRPDRLQAVLAGSLNAVRTLPASHRGMPLLAVGDATAEEARRRGFRNVRSASGDAAALAALAARTLDPTAGPLLLPTRPGEGQRLAADLRNRGFRVLRRVTYDACPADRLTPKAEAALREREVAAVLFFSASAARVFARLVRDHGLAGQLAEAEALAISEAAASGLTGLTFRRIRSAARPDQDSLLALLAASCGSEGMGKDRG
ncbi:MAG: uroporphyrinogen-III synthase [Acetobacteraceae bacterium]|nr:uroporphyrinogen-III synthase [Acetobacteraceae bacterium]